MDNIDNEVAEEQPEIEETQEETQGEEVEEQEEDQPEETPEEAEEPEEEEIEEPKPSRRESLRIQKLLEKYGNPTETKAPKIEGRLDYNQALDADADTIQKFEADRQFVSDAAYQEGLKQSQLREWQRDIKYELPTVKQQYKFLDPNDKENYSEPVAKALDEKYLRMVGFEPASETRSASVKHPDVSYLEFVESEMEFADEIASYKVATTTKNIAKQAATTGLRPDGSRAKSLNLNKEPEDMSNEELNAYISRAFK